MGEKRINFRKIIKGIKRQGIRMQQRLIVYWCVVILTLFLATVLLLSIIGVLPGMDFKVREMLSAQQKNTLSAMTEQTDIMMARSISLSEDITKELNQCLTANGKTFSDLNDNPQLIMDLEAALYPSLKSALDVKYCSGVFVVLDATVNTKTEYADTSRMGIYLRLSDLKAVNTSKQHVVFFRGNADIARAEQVQLHNRWNLEFDTSALPGYEQIMQFDYFYGDEAEQFTFYRIPKVLITSQQFKKVSDSAKLLYGLMLDRMGLSIRNGWFDEQNRAYIFFTVNDIMEQMNCKTEKATKLVAELKGIGLIERVKQGQGKPSKIYLKKFINSNNDVEKSIVSVNENQDFGKSKVQTFGNRKSRVLEIENTDFRQSKCNYTDINNTDFNNINPIHQSEKLSHPHNESWIEKYNKTISQIKSQISYDSLILTNDTGIINDIVEVMADVMLLDTPSYKIEKKEIPSEIVRIRYKQLTYEKIETLLLDFNNITYEIHSKTSYLISSLYNISKTAETSLTNRVKHNMYDLC